MHIRPSGGRLRSGPRGDGRNNPAGSCSINSLSVKRLPVLLGVEKALFESVKAIPIPDLGKLAAENEVSNSAARGNGISPATARLKGFPRSVIHFPAFPRRYFPSVWICAAQTRTHGRPRLCTTSKRTYGDLRRFTDNGRSERSTCEGTREKRGTKRPCSSVEVSEGRNTGCPFPRYLQQA